MISGLELEEEQKVEHRSASSSSSMTILHATSLTPSGRPVLQQGEYEVHMLDKVDLEFVASGQGGIPGQLEPAYKDGYVVLTSRRLIWIQHGVLQQQQQQQPHKAASMPVSGVYSWAKKSQLSLTGTKVRVELQCWIDKQGVVTEAGLGLAPKPLMLRCRGEPPDAFTQQLEAILQAVRSAPPRPHASPASAAAAPSGALAALPPPPPPPAPVATITPGASAAVDARMLQQMIEMGFPKWPSARALLAVRNSDVQAAIDHLLAFGEQPGSNEPFDLHTGQPLPAAQQQQAPSMYGGAAAAAGIGPLTAGLQAMGAGRPPGSSPYPPGPAPYPGAPPPPLLPFQPPPGVYQPPAPPPPQGPSYLSGGGGGPGTYSQGYDAGSEWGSSSAASMGGSTVQMHNPLSGYAGNLQQQQQQAWGSTPSSAGGYTNPLVGPSGRPTQDSSTSAGGGGGGGGGGLGVGVSGIVRREAAKTSEAGRVLDSAFQDLRALMAVAADMVALAERFRGVSAAQVGSGGGQEGDDMIDQETLSQLLSLGIASPVTKENAGGRYQVELCKQLADWLLAGPLTKAGGLMPLTDVYCLFNRARGTELVSPDDLLAAAKMFQQVSLPLSLRTLSSGMLAVQGADFSDERVCQRIAALVQPTQAPLPSSSSASLQQQLLLQSLGPAVTSSEVAKALGCSTTLAAEHLAMAEQRGVLCRDVGPEGLRFFRNFILEAHAAAFQGKAQAVK